MSGSRLKCARCGRWLAIIDWTHPQAAQLSDRIIARHAIDCIPPRHLRTCEVPGCDQPARARGWCAKHHTRWQRHGHPTATKANPPKVKITFDTPRGSLQGQRKNPLNGGPERAQALPGVEPVRCDRCGVVICADPTTPALGDARANHARYCKGNAA